MLWKLNKDDIESSRHAQIASLADFGLKEKDLENFLGSHPTEVISENDLMLIGQERAYQEEADLLLLALDKDGTLYIFELKRWESHPDNVLQVLRYGQKFGRYDYDELARHAKQAGSSAGDLREQHAEVFQRSPLDKSSFNKKQVFVLITDGVDEDTISAVNYWSGQGISIVCIPYSVYNIDGQPYLQLRPYSPTNEVIVERATSYFVANTNGTWEPDVWKDMIGDGRTGKAAAYYDRKHAITNIPKGATVFLYHTGTGIVAKGHSKSDFQKTRFHDAPDEEFYVPLEFEWALSKEEEWGNLAPTARDINQTLQTGHRFRQTVFSISEEMADAIDRIAKKKGQAPATESRRRRPSAQRISQRPVDLLIPKLKPALQRFLRQHALAGEQQLPREVAEQPNQGRAGYPEDGGAAQRLGQRSRERRVVHRIGGGGIHRAA